MSALSRSLARGSLLARSAALPLGVTAGLWVAGAWLELVSVLNHDVGWLLVGTHRLLEGARLYVEGFVDVNPPGILYWMAPASLLARASGMPETRAYPLYVLAWSAASLALCDRLLRVQLGGSRDLARRWAGAGLAFLFLILPVASREALMVHSLGQREHWVALFLLPFALLGAVRMRGLPVSASLAAVTGALTGVALCIKPQYLVAFVALEGAVLLRRRSLRSLATPEVALALASGAAYLASILVFTPAYLEVALPLALSTYWAYQRSALELVSYADLAFLACAALSAFAVRGQAELRELALSLLIATAGCYVAFLLGGTDWPYHALPFRSAALAALLCAALLLPSRRAAASPGRLGAGLAGLAAAALTVLVAQALPWGIARAFHGAQAWKALSVGVWEDEVRRHAPGGAVYALSSALPPAFPLVNYAGVEWSSRFSCLWVLPAVIRAKAGEGRADLDSVQRVEEVERYLVDAVVADLETRPPDLVLVDTRRVKAGFRGLPFDFLAYFLRDARFRSIWSAYRSAGALGGFDLYVRAARGTPGG